MRKADSQLEFDLDLAAKEGKENPVFYVQYGHARISSILGKCTEKGLSWVVWRRPIWACCACRRSSR